MFVYCAGPVDMLGGMTDNDMVLMRPNVSVCD